MTWYRDPTRLWLIIGGLTAALIALSVLKFGSSATEETPPASQRGERTEACMEALRAGKKVAKAAGTALYVAPDGPRLAREALATSEDEAERQNIRKQIGVMVEGLRMARSLSNSGNPPAWRRFEVWSARCLGEPAFTSDIDSVPEVRNTVRTFMRRRIAGRPVGAFLDADGRAAFQRGGALHPLYPRPPLKDFRIAFVDGLGDGSYEVGVRHIFGSGSYGETFFVHLDDIRILISGGRSGLQGP